MGIIIPQLLLRVSFIALISFYFPNRLSHFSTLSSIQLSFPSDSPRAIFFLEATYEIVLMLATNF